MSANEGLPRSICQSNHEINSEAILRQGTTFSEDINSLTNLLCEEIPDRVILVVSFAYFNANGKNAPIAYSFLPLRACGDIYNQCIYSPASILALIVERHLALAEGISSRFI